MEINLVGEGRQSRKAGGGSKERAALGERGGGAGLGYAGSLFNKIPACPGEINHRVVSTQMRKCRVSRKPGEKAERAAGLLLRPDARRSPGAGPARKGPQLRVLPSIPWHGEGMGTGEGVCILL